MIDTGEKEKAREVQSSGPFRGVRWTLKELDQRARRTAARPEQHPVRQQAQLAVRCMTQSSCRLTARWSRNVDFETIRGTVIDASLVRGLRV